MMKYKTALLSIMFCTALAGCSHHAAHNNGVDPIESKINELSSKVDALAYQVEALKRATATNKKMAEEKITAIENEVATIFASSSLAYDEAMRAHSRINNLSQSYTK